MSILNTNEKVDIYLGDGCTDGVALSALFLLNGVDR